MLKKICIYFYLLPTLAFSAEVTRAHTEYYPNGNIKVHGFYTGKIKSGVWKLFSCEGIRIKEYSYIDGNNQYKITNYSNTGIIQNSGLIKNNKQYGEWHYYDEEGYLLETIPFINGVKHGISFTYNRESNPTYEIHYENGVPTVTFTIERP